MRADIRSRILAALEMQIPLHEAALARLTVTENLDAWSAYHLGLQHMYRFNRTDNAAAARAVRAGGRPGPGLRARARGAVVRALPDRVPAPHGRPRAARSDLARRFAERGLELDPLDPFVNFTMGRTYWLEGDLEAVSPGSSARRRSARTTRRASMRAPGPRRSPAAGLEGREHVDLAMRLSPLDPLHYAMLGTRAFAHMARGEDAQAADWAERAARSPGAHVLIAMIAAAAHALAATMARAASWAANVRARNPRSRARTSSVRSR